MFGETVTENQCELSLLSGEPRAGLSQCTGAWGWVCGYQIDKAEPSQSRWA